MIETEKTLAPMVRAVIEAGVEEVAAEFTKVGDLKRLNRKQREALRRAFNLVWGLPKLLMSDEDSLYHRGSQHEAAAAWRSLTFTLKHVDPLWHTRGPTPIQAAYQAVGRLVDPDVPPRVHKQLQPTLRALVLQHFGEDERQPVQTDAYFQYLGARDLYKDCDALGRPYT